MTQDPNQTGPYEPQGTEPRHRPQRSRAADPAPGSDESTHIWADGIGLGGDDDTSAHRAVAGESRPTGYAAAGQPTGGGSAFGHPEGPSYGPSYDRGADPYAGAAQPPFLVAGDGSATAGPGAVDGPASESPFAALGDLTFTESAAPKVTRYLYLLLVLAGALYWIGAIVSGFSIGGAAGLAALFGGAVMLAAWILLVRVGLEVALSVIRLGEDTRALREKLAGSPDAPAGPEQGTTPGNGPA